MLKPVRKDSYIWEIPRMPERGMRVPVTIYSDDTLMEKMRSDRTLIQAANVAALPGVQKHAIVLPDGHEGYGFPIGGVAAFDINSGIISPGGIGYDINCGVRVLTTPFREEDVKPRIRELVSEIFRLVPCGVGSRSKLRLSFAELDRVCIEGVNWALKRGFGFPEDNERLEEGGCMEGADPRYVSNRAKSRGMEQLGTLGAGNHFLEIQVVDKIYSPGVAKEFGIREEGMVTVMIHTGSRGFGHQVASDYIAVLQKAVRRYGIKIPDRELVCAPWGSKEAEQYFAAMVCAVNFAFTNRHIIMHQVREAFGRVFGAHVKDEIRLVYDVCHNIGKIEEHEVDGKVMKLIVHRKGATRAFGPGRKELPKAYRSIGQPVLIPGSMGTASYILVGIKDGERLAFASTAHGAGRLMSRAAAVRRWRGEQISGELSRRGIVLKAASMRVVAEEAPQAYKDVDRVVEVSHKVGLAKKVSRMVPIGVVKG